MNLRENDKRNLDEIRNYLDSLGVKYEETIDKFEFDNEYGELLHSEMPVIKLLDLPKGKKIELRYVNSFEFPLDNSKWGPGFCGTSTYFFSEISKIKRDMGIRVIWIKDYEMDELTSFKDYDGSLITNYRRKWEVLKSLLSNACGRIRYHIYARDCEVKEINPTMSATFLRKYCFYGPRGANKTLGLFLKKDKCGLPKGTLLFLTSFGMNFYGNKTHKNEPFIEVIRVGTMAGVQVVGGASKLLTHFINEYPVLHVARKEGNFDVPVDKIVYYVDADHNDGNSMAALGYDFRYWDNGGFHNIALEDINIPQLKVSKGQMFQRKPMIHKTVVGLMKEHKVISIGNAGTIVYDIHRDDYKRKLENHEIFGNAQDPVE